MTTFLPIPHGELKCLLALEPSSATGIFNLFLQAEIEQTSCDVGASFLDSRLRHVESLPCDLPESAHGLMEWMNAGVACVTAQYADYLAGRKAGKPRRYFANRSHAISFLQGVAPTKLVDGAWLYGLLSQWRDPRFRYLIRTYLEELGDGSSAMNHVVIYKKLLAQQSGDPLQGLSDEHFEQAAMQLSLAYNAERFLPEIIGFNLGYEQLPLHLLISAFELNELEIDPYYFKLHVTIDNASTGHAWQAVQSLLQLMPEGDAGDAFYQRVRNGYRLNDLGAGSTTVITQFDLDSELLSMLERKSAVAGQVHSDYCRISGRTVNEWLSSADGVAGFLEALQACGWIKRHSNPEESRFWHLIEGERAVMFGVFSPAEKQLVRDWIAGNWVPEKLLSKRNSTSGVAPIFRDNFRKGTQGNVEQSADETEMPEVLALKNELVGLSLDQRMALLARYMSPATHPLPVGLAATRLFSKMFQ